MNSYRCGHPDTDENTRYTDLGPRCLICRRAIERAASKRYRERRKAA